MTWLAINPFRNSVCHLVAQISMIWLAINPFRNSVLSSGSDISLNFGMLMEVQISYRRETFKRWCFSLYSSFYIHFCFNGVKKLNYVWGTYLSISFLHNIHHILWSWAVWGAPKPSILRFTWHLQMRSAQKVINSVFLASNSRLMSGMFRLRITASLQILPKLATKRQPLACKSDIHLGDDSYPGGQTEFPKGSIQKATSMKL